ncbi:hypothetical protein TWF696_009315 [Orbilia brochopaga]|uniref:Uncharacterized protein n=1 Tax=Orbilia brochopaga TaxID=3140254 RepID=A0AAV9UEP4_9PEZI
MGRSNMQWTPQADQKLLLAIIAASPSPVDIAKVALLTGWTKNNISWHLYTLKKDAAKLRANLEGGETSVSTTSKKRSSPSEDTSPSKKKRTAKGGKKKNLKFEDTSDEEPMTPKTWDSDDDGTPSLRDETDNEEETGPSSIEPETPPTKIMPRRGVKLEPGDYAKMINAYDSEDEFFDE